MRRRTIRYVFFLAAFLPAWFPGAGVRAQEGRSSGNPSGTTAAGSPGEPGYATLLSARCRRGEVVVTFQPSGDRPHALYRSTRPLLNETDLEQALVVARVGPGQVPVADIPDQDGRYFYAVIPLPPREDRVVLVPFHNTMVYPVDFAPFPRGVEEFQVSQQGAAVAVRFTPSRPGSAYRLYLSEEPFQEPGSMQPARSVQGGEDGFVLVLEPGKPCYFGITEVNRLGVENRDLVPGKNLSREPFVPEDAEPPAPKEPKTPGPEPEAAPRRNYDREMDHTIRQSFLTGRYERALSAFLRLLTEELTARQRGRASFYAGQSAYYLGRYREALRFFIVSKENDGYRDMAELWIHRCLEMLERPDPVR